MKIGLMGAPGSGKTALAWALSEHHKRMMVVDEYAEEFGERNDFAIGPLGSYAANLGVAIQRVGWERMTQSQQKDFDHTVTCGTLLDTATYASMDGVVMVNEATNDAERDDNMKRVMAIMNVIGILYVDTFDYDHVFYLPARDTPEHWSTEMVKTFDQNLQLAFHTFNLTPVTLLVADTMEEQLTLALNHMAWIAETK